MTDERIRDAHEYAHAHNLPHTHDGDDGHPHHHDAGHEHVNAFEYGEVEDHEAEFDHEYMHAHGIPHTHHEGHTHAHEHTKAVLNRLSRAIGHLQSVRRMVEDGRDCTEVLVQLAAVRSAIDNTGKIILQDHLKHCILEAAAEGDQQAIDDLCVAIDKYMK